MKSSNVVLVLLLLPLLGDSIPLLLGSEAPHSFPAPGGGDRTSLHSHSLGSSSSSNAKNTKLWWEINEHIKVRSTTPTKGQTENEKDEEEMTDSLLENVPFTMPHPPGIAEFWGNIILDRSTVVLKLDFYNTKSIIRQLGCVMDFLDYYFKQLNNTENAIASFTAMGRQNALATLQGARLIISELLPSTDLEVVKEYMRGDNDAVHGDRDGELPCMVKMTPLNFTVASRTNKTVNDTHIQQAINDVLTKIDNVEKKFARKKRDTTSDGSGFGSFIQRFSVVPSVGLASRFLFGTATVADVEYLSTEVDGVVAWAKANNKILNQESVVLKEQAHVAKELVTRMNLLTSYVQATEQRELDFEMETHIVDHLQNLESSVVHFVELLSTMAAEYISAQKSNRVSFNMLSPSAVLQLFQLVKENYNLNPITIKPPFGSSLDDTKPDAVDTFYSIARAYPHQNVIYVEMPFEEDFSNQTEEEGEEGEEAATPFIRSNVLDLYRLRPFFSAFNDTFFKADLDYEGTLISILKDDYINSFKLYDLQLECTQVMARTFVCNPHSIPLRPTTGIVNLPSRLSCAWRLINKFRATTRNLPSTFDEDNELEEATEATDRGGGGGEGFSTNPSNSKTFLANHIQHQGGKIHVSELMGTAVLIREHNNVGSDESSLKGKKHEPPSWSTEDAKYCGLMVDVDHTGASRESNMRYTETLGHHYLFFTKHTKLSVTAVCPTIVKDGRVEYVTVHSRPYDITAVKVSSACDIHTKTFRVSGNMKRVEARIHPKGGGQQQSSDEIDRDHEQETQLRMQTFNFIPLKNILKQRPVIPFPPELAQQLEYTAHHATISKTLLKKQQDAMEKIENMPSWWEFQLSYITSWSVWGILGLVLVGVLILCSCRR